MKSIVNAPWLLNTNAFFHRSDAISKNRLFCMLYMLILIENPEEREMPKI